MDIILAFDNDSAGDAARDRAVNIILDYQIKFLDNWHIHKGSYRVWVDYLNKKTENEKFYKQLRIESKCPNPKFSDREWLSIFPEAKEIIKGYIADAREEIIAVLDRQSQYKRDIPGWNDRWLLEMAIETTDQTITLLEKRIRRWQFLLSRPKKGEQYNIEQAKRVPIADLYEGQLRPVGGRLQGKCPFHNEKTPSFVVYVEQNKWHCFGCGENGDSIDFIQKRDNIGFLEAIKYLLP